VLKTHLETGADHARNMQTPQYAHVNTIKSAYMQLTVLGYSQIGYC